MDQIKQIRIVGALLSKDPTIPPKNLCSVQIFKKL